MGLTKPRAHQLFDIDYKQAVRVITTSNVTLSGGAPLTVDGVELVAKDRVLVIGQNTASQNGLYQVTVAGSGSNGTWDRSQDADQNGELLAGAIVMVTEGTVFADTQWKLITNNPIVIGTTALDWEQNSAFAFGNIFANGTAVLANTVGDTLTLTAGNNIAIVGNASSKTVTIAVTGISLNSISNGTSNVSIPVANGNVTTAVNGNNIIIVTSSGANVTGVVAATGNVTGGNLTTAGLVSAGTTITATGNITGGNLNTGARVVATGNVTGGNLTTAGRVDATGNITGGNLTTTGTAAVATLTATTLVNATAATAATSTTTGAIRTAGGVGVVGNVHVGGALVATTKSFAIDHPSQSGMILYHGCLEGPEHAVYVRGRCRDSKIPLPDYWRALIDPDSITVHLTPVGECEAVQILDIYKDRITIKGQPLIDCFYLIHATRCDVPSLEIEVPGTIQDLYRNH